MPRVYEYGDVDLLRSATIGREPVVKDGAILCLYTSHWAHSYWSGQGSHDGTPATRWVIAIAKKTGASTRLTAVCAKHSVPFKNPRTEWAGTGGLGRWHDETRNLSFRIVAPLAKDPAEAAAAAYAEWQEAQVKADAEKAAYIESTRAEVVARYEAPVTELSSYRVSIRPTPPDEYGLQRVHLYVSGNIQLTPNEARALARSLRTYADSIDEGRRAQ